MPAQNARLTAALAVQLYLLKAGWISYPLDLTFWYVTRIEHESIPWSHSWTQ
jgi:hypothetical protein